MDIIYPAYVLFIKLIGLCRVGTVQKSFCTGLPFVQVQWTKYPRTLMYQTAIEQFKHKVQVYTAKLQLLSLMS